MWKTDAILMTELSVHRERAGGGALTAMLPITVYWVTVFTAISLCSRCPCAVDHFLFWLSCFWTHAIVFDQIRAQPSVSLEIIIPRWAKVFPSLSLAVKVQGGKGGWQGCWRQLLPSERHLKRGDMTMKRLSSEPRECLCIVETLFRYQDVLRHLDRVTPLPGSNKACPTLGTLSSSMLSVTCTDRISCSLSGQAGFCVILVLCGYELRPSTSPTT